MPRLSSRAQAVQGAGGVVSVDGGPQLATGWLAQWLDDDRIIYSGDRVEALNVVTGEVTVLHGRGVNNLSANGGKWLGWNSIDGLCGDAPPANPDTGFDPHAAGTSLSYADGRGAIGRDGTVAYVPNRQLGSPTVLRTPDGTETAIHGAPYGLQVLGPRSAVWTGGALNAPAPPVGAISPKVCGDWMVYYRDGQGLVGRRIGTSLGVIFTTGVAFNHDAFEVGGDVLAAWSTTQGEMPGDLRTLRVSQCPLVDLDAGGQLEPIVDVNRALHFSCYDRGLGAFPRNFMFADGFPIPFRYITGHPGDANPDDIERVCAEAGPGLLPRLPYVPHGVRLPRIELAEWIGIECYQKTWETSAQFEQSRREVARAAGRPVVYIFQCYSSNAHNVGFTPIVNGQMTPVTDPLALRRIVRSAARLLRDTPNCVGCLVFSGGEWRVSGYKDHPEVHGDYQQLASTIQTPAHDGGGGGPIDPGDPPVPDPTGPIVERIVHPRRYARNEIDGLVIRTEVGGPRRAIRVRFKMVDAAGVSDIHSEFELEAIRGDLRGFRVFGFKAVVNGRWFPQLTFVDTAGHEGRATSPLDVEVVEGSGGGGPVDPPPPPAGVGCVNGVLADPKAFIFAHLSHIAGHPIVEGEPSGGPAVWQPLLLSTGFTHNPPEGAPLPMNAPYFGIAIGVSGGLPTSRAWLPTAVPYDVGDGNKWFIHRVDLIHHETQTWQYHDWTGDPPYVPRPCS